MATRPKTSRAEPPADKLRFVLDEAQALHSAYPDYYSPAREFPRDQLIELAAQRLVARGIDAAQDRAWVGKNIPGFAIHVLVQECLLGRLVETLDRRGDVTKAMDYARRRGCDEYEALDAVEDAIVAVVQRGHGMQSEDSLLRYFRKILWEKISDLQEAKTRKVQQTLAAAKELKGREGAPPQPFDALSATEARNVLVSSLAGAELSFEKKVALLLKYGADWSSAQIAELLKTSAPQIDVMNHRSKAELRDSLGPDYPDRVANPTLQSPERVRVEAVAHGLTHLTERAALTLYGLFDMPLADVARVCDVPSARIVELTDEAKKRA